SLSDDGSQPAETAEAQASPASENELKEVQVGLQTPPTLAPEPTPLPPEAIAEADSEELLLINLYERVNPSVVNIIVTVADEGATLGPEEELFPSQGQGS